VPGAEEHHLPGGLAFGEQVTQACRLEEFQDSLARIFFYIAGMLCRARRASSSPRKPAASYGLPCLDQPLGVDVRTAQVAPPAPSRCGSMRGPMQAAEQWGVDGGARPAAAVF